ncbi:MAG: 30S ribosomal protein S2 [Planctomycetes bacterium]|nr:30S ribosomal protein S2 [Planctomycetota bacterium]
MQNVTVKELIDSGVHFGCPVSRWNPKMRPFIWGRRNLIHIMDLRETLRGLIRAQNFLMHVAADGHQILWVGTKRQVKGVIRNAGERTGMPIVTERWIGGTLTNFSVIRSRLRRLEELEQLDENGAMQELPKKMQSNLRRERKKIERNLSGIREMTSIPGAVVIVDPAREHNAVREARRLGVPLVGILDTDCDPSLVDIVIPGNDDALKSVRVLIESLASAVEEGCQNRKQVAIEGPGKGDQQGGDEPRPTRGNRPPPAGARRRQTVHALPGLPGSATEEEIGVTPEEVASADLPIKRDETPAE